MAQPHSLFSTPTRPQALAQRLPIGPTPTRARSSSTALSLHPQQHQRSPSGTAPRLEPSSPTASTFSGAGGVSYSGTSPASFLRARPAAGSFAHPLAPPRPSGDSRRRSGPRALGERLSAAYSLDSHPDIPDDLSLHSAEESSRLAGTIKSREPLLPLSRADISTGSAAAGAPPRVRDSLDALFRRLSSAPDGGLERHSEEGSHTASTPRTSAQKASLSRAGSFALVDGRPPHAAGRRSTGGADGGGGAVAPAGPLWAVPRVDKAGRAVRRYAVHPARNRFALGGRVLTGGDAPWAFAGALALVLAIAGAWFGTTCVWWARHRSAAVAAVGGYMCALTVSAMLATALRDPGILPRGLDPDPPYSSAESAGSGGRVPLPRDLKVRKGMVRVKYCGTCRMYRPPRSSHCKMCDNCVEGCDHHCQWVNNCVGHRNYTTFFAFLISAVLTLALVICTSAIHLYLLTTGEDGVSFVDALGRGAGSAVAFSLSVVVIWPITALAVYHVRLLLLNVTTIEQIRNQAHKKLVPGPPPPNPFSHGNRRKNLANVLCRPEGYSWLEARAVVTDDLREVNPGMKAA